MHASTTDLDAGFIGHELMENRAELGIDARLTRASGCAETYAAGEMIERRTARH